MIAAATISSSMVSSAHTAIFGLPSKEVQESSQGLADQAKADPEYAVPNHLARDAFDPGQGLGDYDQGQLDDHAEECNTWERSIRRDRGGR